MAELLMGIWTDPQGKKHKVEIAVDEQGRMKTTGTGGGDMSIEEVKAGLESLPLEQRLDVAAVKGAASMQMGSKAGQTVLSGVDAKIVLNNDNAISNFATLENCSNLSGWTLSAGTPASANITQTTDYSGYGPAAFHFKTAAVASINAMINQDRTFNLNKSGGMWVLWNNRYLVSGTTPGLNVYFSHSIGNGSDIGRVQAVGRLNPQAFGRNAEWIANSDFATLDGTPNFANDWKSWRFLVSSAVQDERDYTVDGVVMPSNKAKAKIIFTLDDCIDTGYSIGHVEAFKRAIPLTHYIIAAAVNTASHSTSGQIELMKSRGDYIGVHGWTQWTNISALEADIAALRAQGLADLEHGAWPDGVIGTGYAPATVITAAKELGLKTIRKTSAGGNGCFLPGYQELGVLPAKPLAASLSITAAKAFVDKAIASGGVLIFYGHKFGAAADTTTWVTSDWIELLDYVAQKRLDGVCECTTVQGMYQDIEVAVFN